jgi:hypothetical protein
MIPARPSLITKQVADSFVCRYGAAGKHDRPDGHAFRLLAHAESPHLSVVE